MRIKEQVLLLLEKHRGEFFSGEEIAQRIYDRHKVLTRFLIRLGVSESVASADACKIEHDLSEETYTRIKEHAVKHGVSLTDESK